MFQKAHFYKHFTVRTNYYAWVGIMKWCARFAASSVEPLYGITLELCRTGMREWYFVFEIALIPS